uniref:Uncharacterized protein n=1 Tax=Zea mays TaxID=4577 RepID=C4J8Q7_MAIZE|nr:unknown [Zea mays]
MLIRCRLARLWRRLGVQRWFNALPRLTALRTMYETKLK